MTFQKDDIKEKSYEKSGKTANYKKKKQTRSEYLNLMYFLCCYSDVKPGANVNVMRTWTWCAPLYYLHVGTRRKKKMRQATLNVEDNKKRVDGESAQIWMEVVAVAGGMVRERRQFCQPNSSGPSCLKAISTNSGLNF